MVAAFIAVPNLRHRKWPSCHLPKGPSPRCQGSPPGVLPNSRPQSFLLLLPLEFTDLEQDQDQNSRRTQVLVRVTEAGIRVTWGGSINWKGTQEVPGSKRWSHSCLCCPKYPGTRVGTCMNTCTPMLHSSSTPQMTVPTDRHSHSGHRSPPADVPPWAQTQMHVQLTLTPSHLHGAMCSGEHVHTWSLCTRGAAAGVAGKIWKVDSCSDDPGTSQLPTRISKR